jgi:hypothetical protein
MAKGMRCPHCKEVCWAEAEDFQKMGTYVTYVCRNTKCSNPQLQYGFPFKDKVFEPNDRPLYDD